MRAPHLVLALALALVALPLARPAAAKISNEQIAFSLGRTLGLSAIGHSENAPRTAVDNLFQKATILAKALGAPLPPLPARTGAKAKDRAAVLHYLLRGAGKPIHLTLRQRHGEQPAALFDMATKAAILALIYVPGDSLGTSAAMGIERAAKRAGLPATVCIPLLSKVRGKAPYPQVKSAVFSLFKVVSARLGRG